MAGDLHPNQVSSGLQSHLFFGEIQKIFYGLFVAVLLKPLLLLEDLVVIVRKVISKGLNDLSFLPK